MTLISINGPSLGSQEKPMQKNKTSQNVVNKEPELLWLIYIPSSTPKLQVQFIFLCKKPCNTTYFIPFALLTHIEKIDKNNIYQHMLPF